MKNKSKPFLEEVAAEILQKHSRLEEATVVFPNRRAALYFRKYVSDMLTRPVFSPRLLTIEDYIGTFSRLQVPDNLELIYQLHRVYGRVIRSEEAQADDPESIDQFYFWGDMLLRDFDEVDKYMVNADLVFSEVTHQKEIDANFDFLTNEQREFLRGFWGNFEANQSVNKRKFLHLWRKLPTVYHEFRRELRNRGLAYEGMLHRDVAEASEKNETPVSQEGPALYFVGFNALTRTEEKIMSRAVVNGASVYWDTDAYYVNNRSQEAGRFFREYQEHPVLKKTFPQHIPSHALLSNNPDKKNGMPGIRMFGAAQPIGQVKLMSQVLHEELAEGMKPEETLVVLPDEKLLIPVLHGIAGSVDTMNVTMGLPLSSTPLFSFVELLVDLQLTHAQDHFNHQQVLALLGHPYVVAAGAAVASSKRKEIVKHNWVHIPAGYLATEVELHRLIFSLPVAEEQQILSGMIAYIKSILTEVGKLPSLGDLDKEYAFHFLKFFNRLHELFFPNGAELPEREPGAKDRSIQYKSFLRLFRQLIRAHKIPFQGEPLKGLQVMGVLETRNLDFKNVFILSMNEGAFPAFGSKGSYIPFSIRKAYELPTSEHQDAIYSYLFYRTLQRAEKASIFYNSETDVLGQGEMSRYLRQLLFESGLPVEKRLLHNSIAPQGVNPVVIAKDALVMENLLKLNEGNKYFKGISPSALNTYLECRLKFYFRHVAKIREPDEVEEELDARVLGNFLHDVMERFYRGIAARKGNHDITSSDYDHYEETVDVLIDEVFILTYRLDPHRKVTYGGQRLVVREIVRRFAHRIIEIDKEYAPFRMEGLEQEGLMFRVTIDHAPFTAIVGGKIDRVDRKGDAIRVIDYKTGKDQLNFDSVASLFVRDSGNRNKAAFQTLLYALLYQENFFTDPASRPMLVAGLINRMNLFDDNFSFGLKMGKEKIKDVTPLLPEFRSHLKHLFEELFDARQPFDQTSDSENCRICPYRQICYR